MNRIRKLLIYILVIPLVIFMVVPLIITIAGSFMSSTEVIQTYGWINQTDSTMLDKMNSFKLIPGTISFGQYLQVLLGETKYLILFWNSVFIVISIIFGNVLVSSMAAFAFAKLNFKGRELLFFMYIIIMVMPFQVTLVPNYLVLDKLNLIGKFPSIILPGIFNAFGVFLLRQFMISIPDEIIECAKLEGCNIFQIFLKIVLPITKNGVSALIILSFIDNWSMIEQPLIFLRDENKQILSVFLSSLNSNDMGIVFAASIIYMIPVLLLFFYAKDYLIEGIKNTCIK